VKAKDKNSQAAGNSKQKKQLLFLGSLLAVLAVVLFVQFGGKSPPAAEPTAQALTAPVAAAEPGTPDAPVAAPGNAPAEQAQAFAASAVADNPVLTAPVPDEGLVRSPFSSLWNAGQAVSGAAPEISVPTVNLEATMPSDVRPLAVIDGELHFVGDSIQGWELAEVHSRRILLRSPSNAVITVEMPILTGVRAVPASDG